jgi:hypothetical protein
VHAPRAPPHRRRPPPPHATSCHGQPHARPLLSARTSTIREPRQGSCCTTTTARATPARYSGSPTPRCKVSYNLLVLDDARTCRSFPTASGAWHAGSCQTERPGAAQVPGREQRVRRDRDRRERATPATAPQLDTIVCSRSASSRATGAGVGHVAHRRPRVGGGLPEQRREPVASAAKRGGRSPDGPGQVAAHPVGRGDRAGGGGGRNLARGPPPLARGRGVPPAAAPTRGAAAADGATRGARRRGAAEDAAAVGGTRGVTPRGGRPVRARAGRPRAAAGRPPRRPRSGRRAKRSAATRAAGTLGAAERPAPTRAAAKGAAPNRPATKRPRDQTSRATRTAAKRRAGR